MQVGYNFTNLPHYWRSEGEAALHYGRLQTALLPVDTVFLRRPDAYRLSVLDYTVQ
jgi:hypothetical protein